MCIIVCFLHGCRIWRSQIEIRKVLQSHDEYNAESKDDLRSQFCDAANINNRNLYCTQVSTTSKCTNRSLKPVGMEGDYVL